LRRLAKSGRSAAEPDTRVLPYVVHANLEMQVRAGGVTGRSLVRDRGASRDDLAALDAAGERRQMSVQRRVAVAVDHHDVVSVAVVTGREVDDPGVGGDDRRPVIPRDVNARVNSVRVGA